MKYIGSASAVFLLSALLLSGCNAGREIRLISGPPPMARLPETQFI